MHKCKGVKTKRCKLGWSIGGCTIWCGKVVKCPKCGRGLNYRLACVVEDCPYFEKRRWYHLFDGWRPWVDKSEKLI